MKATGIVRKVDELGRIVLPIELRRTLDIAERDPLEIYVDGSSIVLNKYQPACIFCGDSKDINRPGKNEPPVSTGPAAFLCSKVTRYEQKDLYFS